MAALLRLLLATLAVRAASFASGPTLVTGATGRTGALVYNLLKAQGIEVRGLVRNVTKAKEVLGCSACDESEGIYVGDVTQPATLVAPVSGAGSLVIATSAEPICDPFPLCHFPTGAYPVDIDWLGAKAQMVAFANATAGRGLGQVVLISTMGTTEPEGMLEKFAHLVFYKLNFEAALMASGLPFTIVKPCGLTDDAPTQTELLVGHDDELKETPPVVTRGDVARVVVASLAQREVAAGLRFDLCSRKGTPTPDTGLPALLQSAKFPWVAPKAAGVQVQV